MFYKCKKNHISIGICELMFFLKTLLTPFPQNSSCFFIYYYFFHAAPEGLFLFF